MSPHPARPSVFISYSHEDETWKDRLVQQLRVLELEGDLEIWEDRQIKAGDDWLPEIEAAMANARAAVLLISADFLTSGFIRRTEVPELLRRRQENGLRVIPVIIRPCPWQAVPWLSQIECRPKGASLTKANAEKHFAALALEIRELLTSTNPVRAGAPSPAPRGRDGERASGARHNLPYPRLGDLFTGRADELQALEKDLETNGAAAITQTEAISGLGGIGKTRLAVEHAWRCRNRYTATWFVRANSPEGLRRNLAALAGPELLNLPEWEEQVEAMTVAAVKRWLQEHPGWLMILDNVDTEEAAEAVLEILPALSERGRILITSRLGNWPAEVKSESLHKLSSEEATHFLLQRTDGKREPAEDDAARAADLAKLVDGLPLALEQAAAYIVRHRLRFADYLRAWEGERMEVLKWYDPLVMRYPASVAVTWKQTFDRLSPTPAALLRLMALLAPDPIPVDMFEQGAEHVQRAVELFCEEAGKSPDGKMVREAMADLADYSLITRQDGGMLVVHRMMQEALSSQIPEERRWGWIEGTLSIVDSAFPFEADDVLTWLSCNQLMPHARHIVDRADDVASIIYLKGRLICRLAVYLIAKGLYLEAEPLARRSLVIAENLFGPEHPNVSTCLNDLAMLFKRTNRLEEAEPLMRRALLIEENFSNSPSLGLAIRLNNLALLLQAQARPNEAEPLLQRSLLIIEASFGSGHPRVALRLNNLARLLQDMNRLEEAEPLIRRALAIDEESLGSQHPNVARDLQTLARLLQDTNRLQEAEPLMRRSVNIYDESLGPEHPDSQNAQRNLENLLSQIASADSSDDSDP